MRRIICMFLCLLCVSCANDLHFELPRGPEGPPGRDGKSAYELWVEAVNNKTIIWTDKTGLDDFFRYLKGTNGADGKSAYELWVEEVLRGIDDPHNLGKLWDIYRTDMVHFYQYLTGPAGRDGINGKDGSPGLNGNDGLSAYELWKNLLDIPGAIEWDGGDTLIDFFEYLKGRDGKDGEPGINGLPGSNGLTGEKGEDGANGFSAYELWVRDVESGLIPWPGTTTYADFWKFLKGEPGETGSDGKDGQSAYDLWVEMITDPGLIDPKTGNYWPADLSGVVHFYMFLTGADGINGQDGINGTDGINGNPGQSAYELWKELVEGNYIQWDGNTDESGFFLYLKGKDGADGRNGIDGMNGRDGTDGTSGSDGLTAYELWLFDLAQGNIIWDGALTLQGFWDYLKGADGVDGTDGQSAYALWVQYVADGIPHPHKIGEEWPADKTSIADFYEYLTGKAGQDGVDGEDAFLVIMEGIIDAYFRWVADVGSGNTPVPWPQGKIGFDKFLEYCVLDDSYLTLE